MCIFDSNNIIALFTIVLAISTSFLWWSTHQMWKSTRVSYIAANRPRLRIRHIHSDPHILPIWIYIANVGGSDAYGIQLHAVFTLKTNNRRQPPGIENISYSDWNGPNKLVPGEEGTFELRSKQDIDLSQEEAIFDIQTTAKTLTIVGKIIYLDANKTKRETSFEWVYDPNADQFSKPEKDDQFNYED